MFGSDLAHLRRLSSSLKNDVNNDCNSSYNRTKSLWAVSERSDTIPLPFLGPSPRKTFILSGPGMIAPLWMRSALGIAVIAILPGCITPANTQFPQPFPRNLRAEAQSVRIYDPFPDNSLGPDTNTRPPSFLNQRDPARRAAENRLLRGYNVGQTPAASSTPPRSSYDYPAAVQTR